MTRDLSDASDDALCGALLRDELDVLVDLDGHVPGNRLNVLSRKPSPKQITWLDYFDTTGSGAFDFLIGDAVSTPIGGAQRFVEKVLRLGDCRLCYEPPAYAPEVSVGPASRKGYVTFGSFNRLSKISDVLLARWGDLLNAVPMSRLLLKSGAFNHDGTCRHFLRRLMSHGIARERVALRGMSPHREMLAEYADVDIALDTAPYNGGLTTCEALWMGVPVLTVLGNSMISRQSAAILRAAGQARWVAGSWEEWKDIGIELANGRKR